MILKNSECNDYWNQKVVSGHRKNVESYEIKRKVEAYERVETRGSIKRRKRQNDIIEEDPTATKIKKHAYEIYGNNIYKDLPMDAQNSICLGFNSTLDISNNSNASQSQKQLFGKTEWEQLSEKYEAKVVFADIPNHIKNQLKQIESLAKCSLTKAYQQCIAKQSFYAFAKEEVYFKVYTHFISILKLHQEYLEAQPKNSTEANYCVQVWGPVIDAIFEHPTLKVMWGESVSNESSQAKKTSSVQLQNRRFIGDKIDFRICYRDRDKLIDLLNGEIAKEQANDKKYHYDHTKLSRETKIVADHFYSSPLLRLKDKKSLKFRGIQLAAVEGEIVETRLVENGLYVLSGLGSLRLPTCQDDLRRVRTLLKRLLELKRGCLALARTCRKMNEARKDNKINMAKKRNVKRSPESDSSSEYAVAGASKYEDWIRGSWFPPPRFSTTPYDGTVPPFLLSPPTPN